MIKGHGGSEAKNINDKLVRITTVGNCSSESDLGPRTFYSWEEGQLKKQGDEDYTPMCDNSWGNVRRPFFNLEWFLNAVNYEEYRTVINWYSKKFTNRNYSSETRRHVVYFEAYRGGLTCFVEFPKIRDEIDCVTYSGKKKNIFTPAPEHMPTVNHEISPGVVTLEDVLRKVTMYFYGAAMHYSGEGVIADSGNREHLVNHELRSG